MRIVIDFSPRIGFGDDARASNAAMNYAHYINQLVQNQKQANPFLGDLLGLQNAWPYGLRREPEVPDTHHTAALKAKIIDARYRLLRKAT